MILKTLKPFMHEWDVVRCADHHFRRAIYGLGPYIADYPEQTLAAGTVYGWCVTLVSLYLYGISLLMFIRCDADPKDLDNPNANLRTREQTATLLKDEDPESLWYDHGIVPDFQVPLSVVSGPLFLLTYSSVLRWISLVPTFTSFSRVIFSIKLLKVHTRTISSNGWKTT